MTGATDTRPAYDGVRLAVLNSRLQGVVCSMLNTIYRTGRSGVLNTAKDFSCCIVTAGCELLTTAESLPIHVMSGPDLMARWMREWHPQLRWGDAFYHNSPYHGNSHAADHCILVPVLDDYGVHRFTVLAKAHQADCGNSLPTTYHAAARDVYEEGALIFPMVKVQEDYRDREDVIRMCKVRIRVPEQWWGDYLALLGAARIGERRLLELGREVGWDALTEFTREWFDYSERKMAAALGQLPSGSVTATSAHDPFPGVPDGIPVKVTVEVKREASIEVDLRDNPDCQPCGLNLTEATARTAALVGIFNSIDHTVPPNAGSFRRVRIHLRENCCVGIPRFPTSCSVATTNLADRVSNPVQRAIAELADGAGQAEAGLVIPPSVAVISGNDPRRGNAPFVNQIFFAFTGGAGTPHEDAWLSIGHVGNAGMVLRDSVEVAETHHPIRVVRQSIVPDTEGAGRFRGAPSAYAEYGPVDCSLEVHYASDGAVNPAEGARGGLPGSLTKQFQRDRSGELTALGPTGPVRLEPGETIVSVSSAGGGYGNPLERDPERVRHEAAEGWVTRERAEEVYGVVLDDGGVVDEQTTARLRKSKKEEVDMAPGGDGRAQLIRERRLEGEQ
ncbi:MAG: hydantoinase B/oxoprolinase family protein [Gaiellaceae bacterium]